LALHFVTWFDSLRHIGVGLSTLLVATSPVWAGLAEALLLRKPPRRAFWVGLAVALVGLAIVTYESQGTARGSVPIGCVSATAGAAFLAAYMLLTRDSQTALGTWRTVAWTYSSAAACLVVAAAIAEGGHRLVPPGPSAWAAVAGMALVPQLVGHTTLNYALQRFSAGVVGVATLLEPVFAAALAWPAFGEPITAAQALGAGVLLLGVALVLSRAQAG
jgi:drug/metabolite transporter (DMT)-like permease